MAYKISIETDHLEELNDLLSRLAPPPAQAIEADPCNEDYGHGSGVILGDPLDTTHPIAPCGVESEDTTEVAQSHDVDGMPWDARIHSSTRSVMKDGRWTYKRGIDREYARSIEETLKQAPEVVEQAPAPEVVEQAPAPEAVEQAPTVTVFPDLVRLINEKRPTNELLTMVFAQFGVSSLIDLATQTDKIPLVAAALQ